MALYQPLEEFEDCHAGLDLRLEATAFQEFTPGGEEALTQCVVEAVAY